MENADTEKDVSMVGTSIGFTSPETRFSFGTGLLHELGYVLSGLSSPQIKE